MTTAEWKQQGTFRTIAGYELFTITSKEAGTPLLLLHGFPTASWDWHKIWPELSKTFRLLSFDFLGFGFSEKPWPHAYQIVEQADLCEALLRQLGVRHYHLLAHDYGNSVAQELMARQSADHSGPRLKTVCFLNGGLFPEAHHARPVQQLLAGPLGPLAVSFMSKGILARSFRRIFGPQTQPSSKEIDQFWQLIRHHRGKRCIPGLMQYMEERRLQRERWVPPLLEGLIPVRLINGPEDPVSGRHLAEHFLNLTPTADIVYIDGVGHYPQMEAPAEVVHHVLDFHHIAQP
mgnify:CR=1 FL=1